MIKPPISTNKSLKSTPRSSIKSNSILKSLNSQIVQTAQHTQTSNQNSHTLESHSSGSGGPINTKKHTNLNTNSQTTTENSNDYTQTTNSLENTRFTTEFKNSYLLKNYPIIFWNLILYLSDIRIQINKIHKSNSNRSQTHSQSQSLSKSKRINKDKDHPQTKSSTKNKLKIKQAISKEKSSTSHQKRNQKSVSSALFEDNLAHTPRECKILTLKQYLNIQINRNGHNTNKHNSLSSRIQESQSDSSASSFNLSEQGIGVQFQDTSRMNTNNTGESENVLLHLEERKTKAGSGFRKANTLKKEKIEKVIIRNPGKACISEKGKTRKMESQLVHQGSAKKHLNVSKFFDNFDLKSKSPKF